MENSISQVKVKLHDEPSLIRGLIIIYSVGLIGHLIPSTLSLMKWLTPFVLLISGLMALIPLRKEQQVSFWIWCGSIFIITFIVEVIGITTDAVFGSYEYRATLGPRLWNVPIIIGGVWLMVIVGAIRLTQRIGNTALFLFAVGILVVLFDFFLEPVATDLDYWEWNSQNVPLQNYAVWFSIGAVSAVAYRVLRLSLKSLIPLSYFVIQVIFFAVLRLFL